jgi:hypothetical protein
LNFMPARVSKFAKVAHTTHTVEQTCVSILLIYCTWVCKYGKGTQDFA